MTFNLKISLENEAFYSEQKHAELIRILRELADRLEEHGGLTGTNIRDVNGNTVGKVSFR
jgi:hypothetical protein